MTTCSTVWLYVLLLLAPITPAVEHHNEREGYREPRQNVTELLLALARWGRLLLARALHRLLLLRAEPGESVCRGVVDRGHLHQPGDQDGLGDLGVGRAGLLRLLGPHQGAGRRL